jgi:chromosomal replication initiator protein
MDMVDFETRVAILRRKREELKIQLGDDCLMFIAQHVKSNIRKLEGSMLRVASYASLTRKAPTTETLEYLLRDTIEQENQTALSIEGIQRMVAEYYDIRLGDMTSKQRPQNIAFPRQVAMYLCRELTGQSLPSIGNAFGRNHATVLHAHRSVGTKMKKDGSLRQTILSLQQRLGGVAAPS